MFRTIINLGFFRQTKFLKWLCVDKFTFIIPSFTWENKQKGINVFTIIKVGSFDILQCLFSRVRKHVTDYVGHRKTISTGIIQHSYELTRIFFSYIPFWKLQNLHSLVVKFAGFCFPQTFVLLTCKNYSKLENDTSDRVLSCYTNIKGEVCDRQLGTRARASQTQRSIPMP